MTEKYEEWTGCQMYGHNFKDGNCTDCPERDEAEPTATGISRIITRGKAQALVEAESMIYGENTSWMVDAIPEGDDASYIAVTNGAITWDGVNYQLETCRQPREQHHVGRWQDGLHERDRGSAQR